MFVREATVIRFALAAAATCLALRSPCHAQSLPETDSVAAFFGTGLQRGGPTGHSVVRPAPIFVDASVRHLAGEDSNLLLGGSLRIEIEGAGEVGIVPRAELRAPLGAWDLRPGVGLVFYVSPHTLIGPELSLGLRRALSRRFGFFGMLEIAAFIGGDDVPDDASVLVGTLGVGVDLEF